MRAVVDTKAQEIASVLDALGKRPNPHSRLKALARTWSDQRNLTAQLGPPSGLSVWSSTSRNAISSASLRSSSPPCRVGRVPVSGDGPI